MAGIWDVLNPIAPGVGLPWWAKLLQQSGMPSTTAQITPQNTLPSRTMPAGAPAADSVAPPVPPSPYGAPGAGVEYPPAGMGLGIPTGYMRPPMMGNPAQNEAGRDLDAAAAPPAAPPTLAARLPAPGGGRPPNMPPPGLAEGYDALVNTKTSPPPMMGGAPEGPNFWERNQDIFGSDGRLWDALSGLGQGIGQTPPGSSVWSTLNQGASGMNRALDEGPMRRARLDDMRGRLDDRKAARTEKEAQRKAYAAVIQSLPPDSPLRKWGPLLPPEKLAEKVFDKPGPGMVLDPTTGKYRVDPEWLQSQIQMRLANRSGALGTVGSMDQAAMQAYIEANPGATAWDYMKAKAGLRQGRQTALERNAAYLSRALKIPEAEAARIVAQTKEQSDSAYFADVYRRAIANPATAFEADRIAREAVADRRRMMREGGAPPGSPPGAPPSAPPNTRGEAIPMRPDGKADTSQLRPGQIYTNRAGQRARWNGRAFELVE